MVAGGWRRQHAASVVVLLITLFAAAPAAAQSAEACLSQEFANKSKTAKLNDKLAKHAEINGKKFDFTPADYSGLKSVDDVKAGVYLGVLDTDASIAEDVSLPPGKYDIFVAQVGGQWQAYAMRGGKIVKAAKTVMERPTPPNAEPVFSRGSGCWWLNLFITGIYVCW
ncbi:MAG: hypothetical protein ACJ8BF_14045 [Gemmatimonadales bacterium]